MEKLFTGPDPGPFHSRADEILTLEEFLQAAAAEALSNDFYIKDILSPDTAPNLFPYTFQPPDHWYSSNKGVRVKNERGEYVIVYRANLRPKEITVWYLMDTKSESSARSKTIYLKKKIW